MPGAITGTSTEFNLVVPVHSIRYPALRKIKDLYLLQRALGHRQITTTEVYARVDDDAVRRAVGALSGEEFHTTIAA